MDWLSNIASLDLECSKNGNIFAIAAVFQDKAFYKNQITNQKLRNAYCQIIKSINQQD